MGLAGTITSWQIQTHHFGHLHGTKYSVLVLGNRGIGYSDKPLLRYTTSEMALDVAEIIDHVGWTSPRQLNIIGISLGGMIAQELACLYPRRLQSLSLLCSSARVESGKTLSETALQRVRMFRPKSETQAIYDKALQLFDPDFLLGADELMLPSPGTTPLCGPADTPDGEYPRFDCAFQRFQAQELHKRRGGGFFTKKGFFCQLAAAAGHAKSAA
jgi:pimeloyl-ACP methyl ester carboxylesterase